MYDNWFAALGNEISDTAFQATLAYLTDEGYNTGEAALVLNIVAREIRHDNPDRAFAYMRSFVGRFETVTYRALATLCATPLSDEEITAKLADVKEELAHG